MRKKLWLLAIAPTLVISGLVMTQFVAGQSVPQGSTTTRRLTTAPVPSSVTQPTKPVVTQATPGITGAAVNTADTPLAHQVASPQDSGTAVQELTTPASPTLVSTNLYCMEQRPDGSLYDIPTDNFQYVEVGPSDVKVQIQKKLYSDGSTDIANLGSENGCVIAYQIY